MRLSTRTSVTARSWLTVAYTECPRHPRNETDPRVSSSSPLSLAPFSAVCSAPCIKFNETIQTTVALLSERYWAPFPPFLPHISCLQGRYERADKRGQTEGEEGGGTSPTSRKGNGSERHRAMKRCLRKTREAIDRKTREEEEGEKA